MNDSAHSEAERADQADRGDREDRSDWNHPILFFDGVCGLCNRFVDFMLRSDSKDLFRYAPLQGETARCRLGLDGEAGGRQSGSNEAGDHQSGSNEAGDHQSGSNEAGDHQASGPQAGDPQSFIFLDKDAFYEQSNAVLRALSRLGGAWRLIAVLYVFPRPLRDFVYRIVARNRYRWFGRRDACRLATPDERDRFLP